MIVYKFGGASVKNSECIKNLVPIIAGEKENLVIVVSALGKTTNALEKIVDLLLDGKPVSQSVKTLREYHTGIAADLFGKGSKVEQELEKSFDWLLSAPDELRPAVYDYLYDQVVSMGEKWSTLLVSEWLNVSGLTNRWIDARDFILTDSRFRDAGIEWAATSERAEKIFSFKDISRYVTQGFIGSTLDGASTTLGREGSDYTAAVIANILNASSVVVWKDVPGIQNADPKWLEDSVTLESVSYKDAVEMAFSGAKVIHPKTIKPLHNKSIPLFVRSFEEPKKPGTVISGKDEKQPGLPVFVRKENQVLISFVPHDLSFIIADNLGRIFGYFHELGIKTNLVQASAVSLAVCVDNERDKLGQLREKLSSEFSILYNTDARLLTIRQYNDDAIRKVAQGHDILVEQRTRKVVRLVICNAG